MARAEQKITLQVLWQSENEIRVTPFKEGSVLESTIKTSRTCPFHGQLVAERAREILGILARGNSGRRDQLEPLVSAAQNIYLDLLPAFLKEKLEETSSPNLLLHLDRQLVGIPWELLHDGDAFLGRRFRIGRLVSDTAGSGASMQRAMEPPLSALVVADPCGDLESARAEAGELAELLDEAAMVSDVTLLSGHVTLRQFRDALGEHDILHYAGHAESKSGAAHLRLADGEFTASMLDQLRGRVDFPGLVFLNGCGSSGGTVRLSEGVDPLSSMSDIASSFLMCGSRHVVATLWDVRDVVARRVARAFYSALSEQQTIGAAMAAGRDAVIAEHGEESLLWTGHLLYGDPTWRVVPPRAAALDDFDVLAGIEQKYRTDLGAPESSVRLMAAAMLLRLGDRSVIGTVAKDLDVLTSWLSHDAPQREQRLAAHVVQALATAAGLNPPGPPDTLPDPEAVRAIVARLQE